MKTRLRGLPSRKGKWSREKIGPILRVARDLIKRKEQQSYFEKAGMTTFDAKQSTITTKGAAAEDRFDDRFANLGTDAEGRYQT